MRTDTTVLPFAHPDAFDDPLTSVLRDAARRLLAQAVEAEAEAFLAAMAEERLADRRARVVRRGHRSERMIQTEIGPVPVKRAKLRDRGQEASGQDRITFTTAIVPKWERRTKSLDALSPDRATAEAAIAVFVDKYEAKYPKAVECLTRDREALLTFFDFPAEHWDHFRTSNPAESVFATVRFGLSRPTNGTVGRMLRSSLHDDRCIKTQRLKTQTGSPARHATGTPSAQYD